MSASNDLESRGPIADDEIPRRAVPLGSLLASAALSVGAIALLVQAYVPAHAPADAGPITAPRAPQPPADPLLVDPPVEGASGAGGLAGDLGALGDIVARTTATSSPREPVSTTALPVTVRPREESAESSGEDGEPGLVSVPDLSGLRVPEARRAARALGLRLVIRDELGYAIDTYLAPRYLVRSQRVPAGTRVSRGSEVRALAEDPTPIVSGY